MSRLLKTFACCLLVLLPAAAQAKKPKLPDHWIGVWGAAPFALDNKNMSLGSEDSTLRETVHVSFGGSLIRVKFSNEFGTEPLIIGAAHVALAGADPGSISLTSANALTFNGNPSITIPVGASVVSDPAGITFPAFANLTVSIFLPAQKITHITYHGTALQTNELAPGNLVGQRSFPPVQTVAATSTEPARGTGATTGVKTINSWYFLKGIDAMAPGDTGTVIALGDSITDGSWATPNSNSRWPDVLARRLQANKDTRSLSVLDMGIGGNRILHDGTGQSALARFDRDVLAQSGAQSLIILEGINDIGHAADLKNPYDVVSADDLIAGLAQMVERAHLKGIRVFIGTLTPYVGAAYSSPAGEAIRVALNNWIRTNKLADGFIDFEAATKDPAHPDMFLPSYEHGDHLHPVDAGYKAMGEAIDLKLLTPKK
ncbi:SGNH/GDSL hydrolase family protein [Granulicella sp. WH15]|uniref:SGNH/GDSL hydrolase family protein n=1 Tax=Granulicella sp. WH15 TaxID=2602070 RepID=UPI0013A53A86|nr:SGNH/GDSL hydrolase family protein [Granulicella sp. WH15]